MSLLKIISDTNCVVRCDFQEIGNIQAGELFKLQLKKGCYILEFLVEDIVSRPTVHHEEDICIYLKSSLSFGIKATSSHITTISFNLAV